MREVGESGGWFNLWVGEGTRREGNVPRAPQMIAEKGLVWIHGETRKIERNNGRTRFRIRWESCPYGSSPEAALYLIQWEHT